MFAFLLGFKDWHLEHLDRCLASIRRHFSGPVVVSDLGSRDYDSAVAPLLQIYGAIQVRVPSTEWSRSVALNAAARSVPPGTNWLIFTDADMLFSGSWFSIVEQTLMSPPNVKVKGTLWLTHSRDLDEAATALIPPGIVYSDIWLYYASTPHPTDLGQGGGMVIPRWWFEKVGGFDEFYRVWGGEDNDLVLRAQWNGLSVEWLPRCWVTHQWHRRDWPTQEQFRRVEENRAYLRAREVERGPIVRNQRGGVE